MDPFWDKKVYHTVWTRAIGGLTVFLSNGRNLKGSGHPKSDSGWVGPPKIWPGSGHSKPMARRPNFGPGFGQTQPLVKWRWPGGSAVRLVLIQPPHRCVRSFNFRIFEDTILLPDKLIFRKVACAWHRSGDYDHAHITTHPIGYD